MAPITTVAPKTGPVTKPSAPVSELGKASAHEQSTYKEFQTIRADLAKLVEASKKDPSNAALAAQVQALGKRGAAAYAKWEAAKETLDAAVTKSAGGGKAVDQADRLSKQLPAAERDLAAAEKALSAQGTKMTKAIDAATAAVAKKAPNADALYREATAAKAKFETLAATRDGAAAVVGGLKKGIAARQSTAISDAKAAKVPGAKDVVDLTDLASKTLDEQVRLSGAPVVTVSREDAVKADVARIAQAMKVSPENGAKMLQLQLRGSDVGTQNDLIKAAGPQIQKMVEAAQTNPAVAQALLDTLPDANSYARSTLAAKLVEGVTQPYAPMLSAAIQRLSTANGAVEAEALSMALRKNESLRGPLNAVLTQKVDAVRGDFVEKARDVQKLNTDLARLVTGFGPAMSDAQKSAAIEAFKANHKEEYAAYEAAGAKMAPFLQYAIEGGDSKMQALIPEFLATKAGEQTVMDALAAQQDGQKSLLDTLVTRASQTGDGIKVAGAVTTVLTKGIGLRAAQLAKAGRMGEAEKLIGGLTKNAKLFGVEAPAMQGIASKMSEVVKSGGTKQTVDAMVQEFKNVETNAPGFTGRSAQALKGLGVALSAVSFIDNVGKFDDLPLNQKIKTVADGVGMGVDGGLLAMEVVGKANPASKLVHLGKRVSAVAGAVGAVMDGISAVDAFRKGEHAEGVASGAAAVGGAILATYAFAAAAGVQALPVAGQVIGAVLVIGGTIAKWTIEERKEQKKEDVLEKDAEAFLKAAYPGLPADKLNELSDIKRADGRNAGMVVKDLAPLLGMTPKALMDHMMTLTADQIDDFVEHTKDVSVNRDGKFNTTGPNGLSVTAHWMHEDGLLPKGVKLPPLK